MTNSNFKVTYVPKTGQGFCVDLPSGTKCWLPENDYTQVLNEADEIALFGIDIHNRERAAGVLVSEEVDTSSKSDATVTTTQRRGRNRPAPDNASETATVDNPVVDNPVVDNEIDSESKSESDLV